MAVRITEVYIMSLINVYPANHKICIHYITNCLMRLHLKMSDFMGTNVLICNINSFLIIYATN